MYQHKLLRLSRSCTEANIYRQQPYHSYLLRLWLARGGAPVEQTWWASLENPHTGDVLNFTSLDRLFEFLQDQCHTEVSPEGLPPDHGTTH
jgi:hypothetical protein